MVGTAETLVQWIPPLAGMTGEEAGTRVLRILCWYSLVIMTKRVYESGTLRVSPDGDSNAGLERFSTEDRPFRRVL